MTIKITFIRNSDDFCLIQDPANTKTYKLVLKDMVLIVRRIKASDELWNSHEKLFDVGNTAYIPVTHTTLTHRLVPAKVSTIRLQDLLLGELAPFKIFVCFIDHEAFAGKDFIFIIK